MIILHRAYILALLLLTDLIYCQDSLSKKVKEPYFRKEEILHNGKRYRKYNSYVTLGGGYLGSSMRDDVQKTVGFDFHFHIRRQYFQTGLQMSGDEFLSNNNVQAHLGYGLRKEKATANYAVFGGITYYTGVIGILDSAQGSVPKYYQGIGFYASAQAVLKLSYDLGAGMELFGEINQDQTMGGLRFILFFSGSYRGPKKNFNPNVRSEQIK